MPQNSFTIVIVDDAPEVRALLRARLHASPRLSVVGEGGDGRAAIALAEEHRPTLMLLDVSMPDMDGLEALPRVLDVSPETRVVVYSGFEEQGLVDKAARLGAAAFIEKSAPVDSLVDRLLTVAELGTAEETTGAGGHAAAAAEDQQVLDEHLERFREVFEDAAIGMATMTLTGRLVRVNRALAGLLRLPAADLVGERYGPLVGDEGQRVMAALDEVRSSSLDVAHFEHGLSHDQERRVRATLAPVRDSSGAPLYVFLQVQDVTAEREAIEELRRSEERFRLLVEVVEEYAIFMLDPTGHIVSWNNGAQRSEGYTADEVIGQHFRIFYPREAQDRKHPEYELEVALRVGHFEEEGWRVRKDGTEFWANALITAVFNEAGKHIGFAKVTRDNSERRHLEEDRERAAEELTAANAELAALNERLREVAEDQTQFLAVTAHELRTPIGVLGGTAETLSKHWDELSDEDRKELLDSMTSSTTRLRRLLADLLTASRLQSSALEMHPRAVDVAAAVADVVGSVQQSHPDAEVTVDVPAGLAATADPDRFAQGVDNLLRNALRHGAPPVRIDAAPTDDAVEIRVRDDGGGVPEAMRPRLFDRFATGRTRGGTGLGLFIVRELARAQGGDAHYEPGTATAPAGTFVLTLPRADGSPVVLREPQP